MSPQESSFPRKQESRLRNIEIPAFAGMTEKENSSSLRAERSNPVGGFGLPRRFAPHNDEPLGHDKKGLSYDA
jgi:hypothetical protein